MRGWVVAALFAAGAHGAQAADLPEFGELPVLRPAFSDGLSTTTVNWQGPYIGGQVGYSTASMDLQPLGAIDKNSPSSASFGGFVGYNAQWDDVTLGIEANYNHFSNLIGSPRILLPGFIVNPAEKVINAPTLRGRAGWAVGIFMPYMFGGLALGLVDVQHGMTALPPFPPPDSTKLTYGYTAGLGLDVILSDNVFARAEYEYLKFTSSTVINIDINTLRLGLGYKF